MSGSIEETVAALLTRLDELSDLVRATQSRERRTAKASHATLVRLSRRLRIDDGESEADERDGRMDRRTLGKLLGATAAALVGGSALSELAASPAAASNGTAVTAGAETTAEAGPQFATTAPPISAGSSSRQRLHLWRPKEQLPRCPWRLGGGGHDRRKGGSGQRDLRVHRQRQRERRGRIQQWRCCRFRGGRARIGVRFERHGGRGGQHPGNGYLGHERQRECRRDGHNRDDLSTTPGGFWLPFAGSTTGRPGWGSVYGARRPEAVGACTRRRSAASASTPRVDPGSVSVPLVLRRCCRPPVKMSVCRPRRRSRCRPAAWAGPG